MRLLFSILLSLVLLSPAIAEDKPILINKAFEGASLGKVEKLGETNFRLSVDGQYDERGRNRQPTWYYFRLDQLAGREVTLVLTDLGGEYNDKPVIARTGREFRPVFSEDNQNWQHVEDITWDEKVHEYTLKLRPKTDSVWVAYQTPYPYSRIQDLTAQVGESPYARVEYVGQSVLGRPLQTIAVTDWNRPDDGKKRVWIISRQHAWESGTSFVVEGALRFIVSDDPAAARLREQVIFTFVPTMDPDGCALGLVRFNVNGYDINRNWTIDLRGKEWLQKIPEIWYLKRAIRDAHAYRPIDLVVNLHNNNMNEYLETTVTGDTESESLSRLFSILRSESLFDPSRPALTISAGRVIPASTTNGLWEQYRIPTVLIEQRIGPSQKLGGRRPMTEDRLEFGPQLLQAVAKALE